MNEEYKNEEVGHFSRADRDLLITMHEQIRGIKSDIKDLKDGTSATLNDHEIRIRSAEEKITRIMTWGSIGLLAVGIVEVLVSKYFK